MHQPDILLQTKDLKRQFGNIMAVDGISLSLKRGEILGLLGLNGAGKSTTLKMLTGILAPSSGWVKIAGRDIEQYPRYAKSSLGYLPDSPPLYQELRVAEYLQYCARLHRIKKQDLSSSLERVLSLCHLKDVSQRLIANLSKGYKQRVGLAQALIHQPDLIILDEPSNGLDPSQIIQLRELIKNLSTHCGIVLSSHILPEVSSICHKVAIIHQGKVVHREPIYQNQHKKQERFFLRLKNTINMEELRTLNTIRTVENLEKNTWHISVTKENHEKVIAEIVQRGWQILEFSQARNFLEERFSSLTIGNEISVGNSA